MVTWKELSDLGIFEGPKMNYRVTLLKSTGPHPFSVWVQAEQIEILDMDPLSRPAGILTPDGFKNQSNYRDEFLQEVLVRLKEQLINTPEETRKNLERALRNVRFLDLCQGQVKVGPVIDGVQYYLPSNLAEGNLDANPALEVYNNLLYKTFPGGEHESKA